MMILNLGAWRHPNIYPPPLEVFIDIWNMVITGCSLKHIPFPMLEYVGIYMAPIHEVVNTILLRFLRMCPQVGKKIDILQNQKYHNFRQYSIPN